MDKFIIGVAILIWLLRAVFKAAEQQSGTEKRSGSEGANADDWGDWEPAPTKPAPPARPLPGPRPVARPLITTAAAPPPGHAPTPSAPHRPIQRVPAPPAPRSTSTPSARQSPTQNVSGRPSPRPAQPPEPLSGAKPKPGGTLSHLQTHKSKLRPGGSVAAPRMGRLTQKSLSAAFPRSSRKTGRGASRRPHALASELRGRRSLIKGVLLQEVLSRPRAFDV